MDMTVKIPKKEAKTPIIYPEHVASIFRAILRAECPVDQDKEHVWVMGLTALKTIKYIELVSLGTLKAALTEPREVYRFAISQAVDSIIVCHNHPSGIVAPSESDMTITDRLAKAGKALGIEMVDHVIIAGDKYISLLRDMALSGSGNETVRAPEGRSTKSKTARERVRLNREEKEWQVNTCLLATQTMTAIIDAYKAKKQLRAFDETGKADPKKRLTLVNALKARADEATEKMELFKGTMAGPEE
jgi:DNA repair protein RadC